MTEAFNIVLPSPDEIIEAHGLEASIVTRRATNGGDDFAIPLGAALQMEAAHCTVDPKVRLDTRIRSIYLIGILASGNSLNEEFRYLLEPLFRVSQ